MDLGMSELLVIGIVALIVIGPKDLPEMFRQLGRFTAKMRAMAREFSRAMEQAANESGVSDVARDLKAVTDPKSMGLNAVKDAVDKFERWDPIKNAAKPTEPLKPGGPLTPPPMPANPTPVVTAAPSMMQTPAASVVTAVPEEAPSTPAPAAALGPNTAALYEKKAAKEAIVKEAATKLKALDAAPPVPPVVEVAAKPAPKTPRKTSAKADAPAATATPTAAPKAAAPKAPRKKKAAEE